MDAKIIKNILKFMNFVPKSCGNEKMCTRYQRFHYPAHALDGGGDGSQGWHFLGLLRKYAFLFLLQIIALGIKF